MNNYCSNCGTEVNGNYCSNCGTRVLTTDLALRRELRAAKARYYAAYHDTESPLRNLTDGIWRTARTTMLDKQPRAIQGGFYLDGRRLRDDLDPVALASETYDLAEVMYKLVEGAFQFSGLIRKRSAEK